MDKGHCIEFKSETGSDFRYFETPKQANDYLWKQKGIRVIDWDCDLRPILAT